MPINSNFFFPTQDEFEPEHVGIRSSCELLGFMNLNLTLNFGSGVTLGSCLSGH